MGKCYLLLVIFFALYFFAHARRSSYEARMNAIEVPSGSHISGEGHNFIVTHPDGKRVVHPKTPNVRPHSNKRTKINIAHEERTVTYNSGWVSSFWAYDANFSYFSAYWIVPPIPTTYHDQILFLFNSFENTVDDGIIQPVLDFNRLNTGKWSIASWYGVGSNSSNYFYSNPIVVNPGDAINGFIEYTSSGWYIETIVNYNATTSITASFNTISRVQNSSQLVLEVYDIEACTDYPPSEWISFIYLEIKNSGSVISPTWTTDNDADNCEQEAVVFGTNGNSYQGNWGNLAPTIQWET